MGGLKNPPPCLINYSTIDNIIDIFTSKLNIKNTSNRLFYAYFLLFDNKSNQFVLQNIKYLLIYVGVNLLEKDALWDYFHICLLRTTPEI